MSMLYEPRVFWSVGRIDTAVASVTPPLYELKFDRRHFFNGERWPITVRHLLVAPIGYTLAQFDSGAAATGSQDFRNAAEAAIADAVVRIEAPQTVSYSKGTIVTSSLTPEASWEPVPTDVAGLPGGDVAAGTLHGSYRWEFDSKLVLPASGGVEFGLGAMLPPRTSFVGQVPVVNGSIGFDENGGVTPGNMRNAGPFALPQLIDAAQGFPWGVDGWTIANLGAATNLWNEAQALTAREWKKQKVTAEGSSAVNGFTVALDQLDWDARVMAGVVAAYAGATGSPAPVGHAVPTRARVADGGTRAWWWRPGAPLSLVTPSMTPAMRYTLPQPITLAPGDKLDVALQVPAEFSTFIVNAPHPRIMQIGVSLCGEAAVEQ